MSEPNRLTEQLFRHKGGTRPAGAEYYYITEFPSRNTPNFGIGGPVATQPGGRYIGWVDTWASSHVPPQWSWLAPV
jgi:hypothetical protein